ncbi:hypothetical protein QP246_10105 [Aerococcus urinae]|nr:hypothetical protein [Aerococcus urinae]
MEEPLEKPPGGGLVDARKQVDAPSGRLIHAGSRKVREPLYAAFLTGAAAPDRRPDWDDPGGSFFPRMENRRGKRV